MFFTVVSPKYQGTFGLEVRKALGIRPGTRMKGTVENGRVIFEPVGDLMDSYGVFSKYAKIPPGSIQEETKAMELAVAREVMVEARDD